MKKSDIASLARADFFVEELRAILPKRKYGYYNNKRKSWRHLPWKYYNNKRKSWRHLSWKYITDKKVVAAVKKTAAFYAGCVEIDNDYYNRGYNVSLYVPLNYILPKQSKKIDLRQAFLGSDAQFRVRGPYKQGEGEGVWWEVAIGEDLTVAGFRNKKLAVACSDNLNKALAKSLSYINK